MGMARKEAHGFDRSHRTKGQQSLHKAISKCCDLCNDVFTVAHGTAKRHRHGESTKGILSSRSSPEFLRSAKEESIEANRFFGNEHAGAFEAAEFMTRNGQQMNCTRDVSKITPRCGLNRISVENSLRGKLANGSRNLNEIVDDTDLIVCGHDRDERDCIIKQFCHATCRNLAIGRWRNEREAYAAFGHVLCWFEHSFVFECRNDCSVSPLSKPSLQGGRNSPVVSLGSATRKDNVTRICA